MQMPKDLLERITFTKSKDQEPLRIESISYDKHPCDDCDREIERPAHEIRKYVGPPTHSRTKCKNCHYFKDPVTGEFTVHSAHANRRFLEYFKQKK